MYLFQLVLFFWIYTQEWNCRSCNSSIFSFLRNLHTVTIPIYFPLTLYKQTATYLYTDANAGDADLTPALESSLGEGNGNPLQYCCLENPMDGGALWATVHRVTKESDTT